MSGSVFADAVTTGVEFPAGTAKMEEEQSSATDPSSTLGELIHLWLWSSCFSVGYKQLASCMARLTLGDFPLDVRLCDNERLAVELCNDGTTCLPAQAMLLGEMSGDCCCSAEIR